MYGVPKGSRTPVTAVKGRCPRPLDDGDLGVVILALDKTKSGGARRDRTADLYNAIVALSQLSYSPVIRVIDNLKCVVLRHLESLRDSP